MSQAEMQQVELEVRAAATRAGMSLAALTLVSPLGARKGMRFAYRLDLRDGRVVKARHFHNEAEAQAVYALRRRLDDAFAPVLACVGSVLIEAWIDGVMLRNDDERWSKAAGEILGRLHGRSPAGGTMHADSTRGWNEGAAADITLLRNAGALAPAQATALLACLRDSDPQATSVAVIHKDFCAENMLIDDTGRLRIIDTEMISMGPPGFDLGWTWHRWPMPAQSWRRFLAGYQSGGADAPASQEYWRIVTGLILARVFFQRAPRRLEAQIGRLLHCAGIPASTEEAT